MGAHTSIITTFNISRRVWGTYFKGGFTLKGAVLKQKIIIVIVKKYICVKKRLRPL